MPLHVTRQEPSDTQIQKLNGLLAKVPTVTIVQHKWSTDQGQEFIDALREITGQGVPLKWAAEHLDGDINFRALDAAIGYWKRSTSQRGSIKRRKKTLKKLTTDIEIAERKGAAARARKR